MGYSVIKSFERGIDTRRMIDTTEAGAMLDAKDCHVTRGGEIEKRAAFVVTATLPAGTVGFYATRGPTFHTWGIEATAPAGMPPNAVYHNVAMPDDPATTTVDESTIGISAILSVEEFGGKLYVIVLYDNDAIRHWYDDELLLTPATEPPALRNGPASPIVAPFLAIPLPGPLPPSIPGVGMPQTSFYVSTVSLGPPPNTELRWVQMESPGAPVPPIEADWVEPGGSFVRLMDNQTSWDLINHRYIFTEGYTATPADIELQLCSLINAHSNDPQVYAMVNADKKVTVWVAKQTTNYNGWKLQAGGYLATYSGSGGMMLILTASPPGEPLTIAPPFSGGADPIVIPPDPDVDPIPGGPVEPGTFVLAHNEKLYCTFSQLLNFTALRNPRAWSTAQGGGYIDHTMMGEGMPKLVSLADYGGDLAVFAERHIFIWKMDPDQEKNFKRQVLHRTGTIAPHTVVSFGQNEVMYLDRSGIRSLRQREAQDAGFAADLGNNIDELVTDKIRNTSVSQQQHNFYGDVEPTSGRLWMGLRDKIFVLSYFPGNRIAAWTYYDASSTPIDMLNATDEHIYWRSGDNVIVYGGESGTQYDATEALVRAPYIDAGKPAHFKSWTALDAALFGTWQVRASFDPTQPTAFDLLANVTKSTYAQEKIAVNGKSPSVSLELRTTFVGPARIGNAALHYEENFAD